LLVILTFVYQPVRMNGFESLAFRMLRQEAWALREKGTTLTRAVALTDRDYFGSAFTGLGLQHARRPVVGNRWSLVAWNEDDVFACCVDTATRCLRGDRPDLENPAGVDACGIQPGQDDWTAWRNSGY